MPYRHFASLYDTFMQDAPYDLWVRFTEQYLQRVKMHPDKIVDLGCGTGEIAVRLAQKGYRVSGIDRSEEMLAIAMQKSLDNNLDIQWVCQDIRYLEGFEKTDLFISFCDVINYITDERDVRLLFQKVYESLRSGGLFIFDVHSMHYVEQVLKNETFTEDRGDIVYIWDCEGTETKGEVTHYLTFFAKEKTTDLYERLDEVHTQRTFPIAQYNKLLRDAKFQ